MKPTGLVVLQIREGAHSHEIFVINTVLQIREEAHSHEIFVINTVP